MSADISISTDDQAAERGGRCPESLARIGCVSVSHKTIPNNQIGPIAPSDPGALARSVGRHDRVTEAVVLSTCNRVEIYTSTRQAGEDVEAALTMCAKALDEADGIETYTGLDAVTHLCRVACGLESAVLGEDQILGQVNRAFEGAMEADLAGGVLSRVAETAVRVGRKCRSETAINEGEIGYGGALTQTLIERLEDPPESVVVVGAGEMARTAVAAIETRWESKIDVVNRSETTEIPSEDGHYWPLTDASIPISRADAVIAATGAPDSVLSGADFAGCNHRLPVVDLANPPDLSTTARERSNIDVIHLQELTDRVRRESQSRREAVGDVTALIEDAMEQLIISERDNMAEETLRALHRNAAAVRERELEEARTRLIHSDEDPEGVLEEFASALTASLLDCPTQQLRAAARNGETETIDAATRLFDLEDGGNR